MVRVNYLLNNTYQHKRYSVDLGMKGGRLLSAKEIVGFAYNLLINDVTNRRLYYYAR
jgi:hypothetical protein